MSDGYETLNEAVYYSALATREAFGDKAEAISLVYEQDGRFFFTPPASEKQLSDRVRARVRLPSRDSLRFIVHNHPRGRDNEKFSEDDIANAERLGVPSAIIFGPASPTIRIYAPGVTETRSEKRRGTDPPKRWSRGEEFKRAPEPAP